MRTRNHLSLVGGMGLVVALLAAQESEAQQIQAWRAVPINPATYEPPNKPVTRIGDLMKKYAGQQSWSEVAFSDHVWQGEYISMAPGESTIPQFYQDHRVFWFVQSGQMRVEIEGQAPFVASSGFMVQVPKRHTYRMQTVGAEPSVRFEVTMTNSGVLYPVDVTPPEIPGYIYERVQVANAKGSFTEGSPMYFDFNKVISGEVPSPPFLSSPGNRDPDTGYTSLGAVHVVRSAGSADADPIGIGHTHLGNGEAWFVMEGQVEARFGHLPPFVADPGDVLYVPAGWYHALRPHGPGMATRIPLVVFQNSHVNPISGGE